MVFAAVFGNEHGMVSQPHNFTTFEHSFDQIGGRFLCPGIGNMENLGQ